MLRAQGAAAREQCGLRDGRTQLAHVARPAARGQRSEELVAQIVSSSFRAGLLPKGLCEQGHVGQAVTQRRQLDLDAAQPVEQVFAELSRADQFAQPSMGRRDDSHIGRPRLVRANSAVLPRLQKPQQLDLHGHRRVTDLIEEQRPPFGLFDQSRSFVGRAGEGSSRVAEQFALQHRRIQSGQANGSERTSLPSAVSMNRSGHQFLADPGFAHDQDGRVGCHGESNLFVDLLHRGRGSQQLSLADFGHRRRDRPRDRSTLQRASHDAGGMIQIEGLGHVLERAQLDGADGGWQVSEGRHHDDGNRSVALPKLFQDRQAVDIRQTHVEDDNLGRLLRPQAQGLAPRAGQLHVMPGVGQELTKAPSDCRFIVDHQNATHDAVFLGSGLQPLICGSPVAPRQEARAHE